MSEPLWEVDLRALGYSGFAQRREQWGLHFHINPICFSENNSLIATFLTREAVTTLRQRDRSTEGLPLRLHAVFFDATAGKVRAVREWSASEPRGGIVTTRGGRFVVVAPGRMLLYSPNLELLREFKLPTDQNPPFDLAGVYSSASGGSILLQYNERGTYHFQWIDPDALQPVRSWAELLAWITVADNQLVFSKEAYTKSTGFVTEVLIRGVDGPSRTVCRSQNGQGDCDGSPQFVSNEILALLMPHGVTLIRTDGARVFRTGFNQDDWTGREVLPSANGRRFALAIWAHKGGSELFDVSSHSVLRRIVVFDIPSRQWVYVLNGKRQKIKTIAGLALSADGSLMAILTDGVVKVYRLPETPPGPSK